MENEVILLSRPTNFAVVKLRDRNFPGVIFQGDTLNALVAAVSDMARLLAEGDYDELSGEIAAVAEQLDEALSQYERVCHDQNIDLPYSKA
jgi:hypothetical protein